MDQLMLGRRLPDTPHGEFPLTYEELQPGDIWKNLERGSSEPRTVSHASNLTGFTWTCIAPGPNSMKLFANLEMHTVREHDDGTVSVRAGDGSSNSILVKRREDETWHGYIEHNVWTPC